MKQNTIVFFCVGTGGHVLPVINLIDDFHLNSFFESLEREKIFIDYIFHCAAYKHVDLVENNKIYSFKNNMLSTINLVKLAEKFKTTKFVLISSDKADNFRTGWHHTDVAVFDNGKNLFDKILLKRCVIVILG